MNDDCGFKGKEITILSHTLVCLNLNCKAEGLNTHILVIPLTMDDTAKTPSVVLILCKECLNKQRVLYSDYLKMVKLEAIR